jgi:hypothetical protein
MALMQGLHNVQVASGGLESRAYGRREQSSIHLLQSKSGIAFYTHGIACTALQKCSSAPHATRCRQWRTRSHTLPVQDDAVLEDAMLDTEKLKGCRNVRQRCAYGWLA